MPIDPNLPIPLMLEQLQTVTAWQMIEKAIEDEIARCTTQLTDMPPNSSAQEVQRVIGQIEGLKFVMSRPAVFRNQWNRSQKALNQTGANA